MMRPDELVLGVLGNGQLGRMLAHAAQAMGVRVVSFGPGAGSPAGRAADVEVDAAYDDLDAVDAFARQVDVVTYEFENVPVATAERCLAHAEVYPSPGVLETAQDRLLEKGRLSAAGFPVTPFAEVDGPASLSAARDELGGRVILKTTRAGYDGKGQQRLGPDDDAARAWAQHGADVGILEQVAEFELEISVVAARGADGVPHAFAVFENEHRNHILDVTISPARIAPELAAEAERLAAGVMEALDVRGVLCVEMFVTSSGLLINELAPRPHNSGHLTIEASDVSQFEQQLRAVAGWPVFTPRTRPSAMVNVLGDLWIDAGGRPNWAPILAAPDAHLHLYAKESPRVGRKMGHLTVLDDDATRARARALDLRARIHAR